MHTNITIFFILSVIVLIFGTVCANTIADEKKSAISAFTFFLIAILVIIILAVFALRVINWRIVAGFLVAAGTCLLGLGFYLEQTYAVTVDLQQLAMLKGIFWVQLGILCVIVIILFNQNQGK